MALLHVDPPGRRREFGKRDREDAVAEVRADRVVPDGFGELAHTVERTVAAFDLMVMTGGAFGHAGGALAPNRQTVVLDGQVNLIAREAGNLRTDDVAVVGFVDVNRGRPGRHLLGGEPFESLLPRAQVTKRVAGHQKDRSTCQASGPRPRRGAAWCSGRLAPGANRRATLMGWLWHHFRRHGSRRAC